jgi:hypothetical protein
LNMEQYEALKAVILNGEVDVVAEIIKGGK